MALSESALSDLLASLQAADGVDLVRELARWALQELIEVEAAAVIGAGRYERTEGRVTERNGHRPRVVSTKAGDLHVAIPKLHAQLVLPVVARAASAHRQALYTVVMEAYVAGVSTRAVDDLVEAMGMDTGISKSEVSRICAGLDERVAAFRGRTLGHVGFPYVYLDATYVHVRDDTWGRSCPTPSWSPRGSPLVATARSSGSTSATRRTRRLDRVPAVTPRPRAGRGAPGHLRRPRRPARGDPPGAGQSPVGWWGFGVHR